MRLRWIARLQICALITIAIGRSAAASGRSRRPLVRDLADGLPGPTGAAKNNYGVAVSDQECRSNASSDISEILKGNKLPYIFTGPSAECDAAGCKHAYWGRRCRYDGHLMPACSLSDRWRMTSWLAGQAKHGGEWARDVLSLKPCDLWQQLRGRTIWVAGDSISQDAAYGIVCFLVEYFSESGRAISDDEAIMYSLTHDADGQELHAWCFNMLDDTRICSLRGQKGPQLAAILRLLPRFADRESDILMFNLGLWYNFQNSELAELIEDIKELEAVVRELRDVLPKRLLWRETTAQHFDTPSGTFDPSRSVVEQKCAAPGAGLRTSIEMMADGRLARSPSSAEPIDLEEFQIAMEGGHRNRVTQPVIDRLDVETLRLWNLSLAVHEVHRNYQHPDSGSQCVTVECDCSHACQPSWYQMILPDLVKSLQRWNSADTVVLT